ncbi:MAG: site-2 protease family protein [Oscillospiraceae bacterium]|nr:site-2 protease family protein [Oscillospiraceae bacterium]
MGGSSGIGIAKPLELRCGTCRVVMDFGFPAAVCIACLWGDGELLLQCLAVCMLHETGHGLAMWLTRAGIREIRFHAAGMQMVTHTACLTRLQRLCISLSGPAVNLLMAALLYRTRPETALLHLCMGGFNLLPFRVLDGGTALRCLTEDSNTAETLLHVLALLCAALGMGVLWYCGVRNPVLYLMAGYLAVAELR